MKQPAIILIVDDAVANRDTLRELLDADNFQLVEAADGPTALRLAAETPPDLVLLDVMMPGMDGYEVCRRLRADARLAEMPIIMVTALDDQASRLAGIEAGADDFITKPYNRVELRARVRTISRLNRYRRLLETQEGLRESEARFIKMAESSNDVFWFVATNPERMTFLSPAVERIWGRPAAQYYEDARLWAEAIHPDDRPRVRAAYEALISGRAAQYKEEYRVVQPDGAVRWVLATGTPIHDACGKTVGAGGLARDITERKQAEEYKAIGMDVLRMLNEPVDLQNSIQRVVAALKARTGFDAVGIRLQDGNDFPYLAQQGFSEEFLLTENTLIARAADGGLCRNKDGSVCLECTCGLVISGRTDPANPLFTPGGSCWTNDSLPLLDLPASEDPRFHPRSQCVHHGYASVALVPIRNKECIVGLIQLNSRSKGCFTLATVELLEGMAANIGAALLRKQAEARMLRAQRLENIGMLAAGIAHDFNNALAPIVMAGALLRQHVSDPDANRFLDIMEKSAQRGTGLVKQLLSFDRGTGSQRHLLQARHVLREVGELAEATFDKSIRVGTKLPGELWPIEANVTQIHQLFLNLCVNARDAMPQGGDLTLTAANCRLDAAAAVKIQDGRPGDFFTAEVRDTGTGIPPEVLARIWEPFYTTKAEGKGTGLGLSTVRGILQQHGGFVTVQTRPGHGTAFTVYLPAATGTSGGGAEAHSAQAARGEGELILVVDDEEPVRQLAAQILSSHGYRTATACDGAEAIAVFAPRAAEVRLLLTDCQMPILGGPALVGALRRLRPGLPVVTMSGVEGTGGDMPEDITTAHVAKPFQAETLLSIVRRTLDANRPPPNSQTAA